MTTRQFALDFTTKMPPAAQAAKADGMQAADDHANPKWRHFFDGCVLAAARKKSEITSDDVLAEMEALPNKPDTHNLAAIGPAMSRAAKMGVIKATEKVKRSERPEKHGNLGRVWQSKVFVGAQK